MSKAIWETWWKLCHGLVWGCISPSGAGDLVKTDGIMNPQKESQIFICHAIPYGKNLDANSLVFQHGNHLKHIANGVKMYLEKTDMSHGLVSPEPRLQHY